MEAELRSQLSLQEAAAIYDDLNAHHVQSYGPEARGQAARSEVIISNGDIDYPKATHIDTFLATTQEAIERYSHDLKPEAIVVVDSENVTRVPDGVRVLPLPLLQTAEQELQRPTLLAMLSLGVVVALSEAVSKDAIESAVKDHVAKGSEAIHLQALKRGYELAQTVQK